MRRMEGTSYSPAGGRALGPAAHRNKELAGPQLHLKEMSNRTAVCVLSEVVRITRYCR
jgi:hypothetical protein